MENKDKKEMEIFNMQFPIVKKVQARLIADDIKSMTAEETAQAFKKMFESFEKQTGYKPIIVGDNLPTNVLFPKENIKNNEE